MKVIGLTGGIGSGKTAASDAFHALGVNVIDTDLISHELTSKNGKAISLISSHFGSDYIDSEGKLDRKKMRELIFTNANAKLALEQIIHPLIEYEVAQQIQSSQGAYALVVVPLLFESQRYRSLVNYVIALDCSEEMQIERVMTRSQLSREAVKNIMQHQLSRSERNALANFILVNDGTKEALIEKVRLLHEQLLQLSE
ncbi:dephospho-CoA kinase [Leeia sp. TBRC 13508]|uniref:Dephospho-CoA kinase n=1 Tax=Leeia speluncae TaxID=2884804 RepID=A0ABS8D609_9NEIS|nr:dephospho-CoA kinase [Leeia speluncae]MCB6183638.1 dephospho-CoA kinase [Leeia speluncae]